MLSKIPINLELVGKGDTDKEILRAGVIAELDAINLYEQMAAMAKDKNLKKILLDIAKEEKTHVGEFLTLLLRKDGEQEAELREGKKEVEDIWKAIREDSEGVFASALGEVDRVKVIYVASKFANNKTIGELVIRLAIDQARGRKEE